jgi:hypothetical protein
MEGGDPKKESYDELQEALFSQDEIRDFPFALQPLYVKKDGGHSFAPVDERSAIPICGWQACRQRDAGKVHSENSPMAARNGPPSFPTESRIRQVSRNRCNALRSLCHKRKRQKEVVLLPAVQSLRDREYYFA